MYLLNTYGYNGKNSDQVVEALGQARYVCQLYGLGKIS